MDTARVAKLIRLMASSIDGEALGATRALGRVLAESGADFHRLADVVERGWRNPVVIELKRAPAQWWMIAADDLLQFYPEILLGDRERAFLTTMRRSKFPPTGRQAKWLRDIRGRAPEHGRGNAA